MTASPLFERTCDELRTGQGLMISILSGVDPIPGAIADFCSGLLRIVDELVEGFPRGCFLNGQEWAKKTWRPNGSKSLSGS